MFSTTRPASRRSKRTWTSPRSALPWESSNAPWANSNPTISWFSPRFPLTPERIHRLPVPLLQIAGTAHSLAEFHRRFGRRPPRYLHSGFPLLQIHLPRHLRRFPRFLGFSSFSSFSGFPEREFLRGVLRAVGRANTRSPLPPAPLLRGNHRGDLPPPGPERAAGRAGERARGRVGPHRGERVVFAGVGESGGQRAAAGGTGVGGGGHAERLPGRVERRRAGAVGAERRAGPRADRAAQQPRFAHAKTADFFRRSTRRPWNSRFCPPPCPRFPRN